ncbi:MAG TPA: type II toxin-antitoxin system VapC family toxin [Candidatus Sulfotelmatobacter sp.]
MIAYADSSFIVSIYIQSRHSSAADALLSQRPQIYLTPLILAERVHALAGQVFRRQLSASDARRIELLFDHDLESSLWLKVAMPEHAFELCADLARRYGPKLGVRTLDSLHVACALELNAERFWTFDERQAKLAKAVGLGT